MKSELDITYIFIRYVTVTLQRQTKDFYFKQGKIYSHESQELTEIDQNDKLIQSWMGENKFNPEEILEKNFQNEELRSSLACLSDEELFILNEKYQKNLSDAEIGKRLHVSSQMISKKKRKAFTKLKSLLS